MKRLLKPACAGATLAAVLAGCALPPYAPAAGEQTAQVTLFPGGDAWMCAGGQRYSLRMTDSAAPGVPVPAGRRITLGTHLAYQGNNSIASCQPAVSVAAAPGSTLVLYAGVGAGRCFIEVVRADATTETGVAVEPTAGAPSC